MFNTLFELFSDRKEQLELQEQHDNQLKEVFPKCPRTVLNLLLLERENNRNQAISSNDKNIFDLYKNTKNNLNIVNKYQKEQDEILKTNENICSQLNIFIEKYQKI